MRFRQLVTGREWERAVILVTGASGALGQAVCRRLAGWGAVAAHYHRRGEALKPLLDEAAQAGRVLRALQADLTRPAQTVPGLVRAVIRECGGPPSIIVHAASPAVPRSAAEDTPAAAAEMFTVNALALWALVEQSRLPMQYMQHGAIIGVLSEAMVPPVVPGWTGYISAKLAMTGVIAATAKQLEGTGVRAMGLALGAIAGTHGEERLDLSTLGEARARRLLALAPDRVAHLIELMIRDADTYGNGSLVALNAVLGERQLALFQPAGSPAPVPASAAAAPASPAAAAAPAPVADPTRRKLQGIVREVLKIPENTAVEDLRMGAWPTWDSLKHLELLMAVEDACAVDFSSVDMKDLVSFQGLQAAVLRLRENP